MIKYAVTVRRSGYYPRSRADGLRRMKMMRKEINGVVYDTSRSTVDKKFTYGAFGADNGYEETLYITEDGEYFIYTNGGKLSKYPHEEIYPISHGMVKEWVMSH